MSPPSPSESFTHRLRHAWDERATHVKAVSFAVVGVINFAVDFCVFTTGYYVIGLPIIPANVIAWLVAVTGSYILNSQITFAMESGRKLRLKDYAAFALSQTGGLVANTVTVFVLSYVLPVLMWRSIDASVAVAKALAVGASFLVNFSLSHFVVFRRKPTTEP